MTGRANGSSSYSRWDDMIKSEIKSDFALQRQERIKEMRKEERK